MTASYDEIGLLKPQSIDHFTGYRSYSTDQILRVNRIQVLKEMDFTLSEVIDNKKKLLRVETLIKFMSKADVNMKYDITVKNIPVYKVVSLRDIIPAYHEEGKLWQELQKTI